jgi:hypothetical protein
MEFRERNSGLQALLIGGGLLLAGGGAAAARFCPVLFFFLLKEGRSVGVKSGRKIVCYGRCGAIISRDYFSPS